MVRENRVAFVLSVLVALATSGTLASCDTADPECGDGLICSNETCGNGILDGAVGEICDDGNTQDGDACSSCCRAVCPSAAT